MTSPAPVQVLHEDASLLAISKPGGMLSQEDETGDLDVVRWAKQHLRSAGVEDPYVGLVHRLDRPASGVMVLGKSRGASKALSGQFRNRLLEKRYAVLVEGETAITDRWADFIAKADRRARIVGPEEEGGKQAALSFQRLQYAEGFSLVDVSLETGRPHQIRLQFSSRGHPVVGDHRYGTSHSFPDKTIALHCLYLQVEHPEEQKPLRLVAPLLDSWPDHCREKISTRIAMLSGLTR